MSINIDQETGVVSAEGDPAAVTAALQEMSELASGPTVVITLPPDRTKRLMWKETRDSEVRHIDRLREIAGVLSCDLDFGAATLTVTASTDAAIEVVVSRVRAIVGGAEGVVTLSHSAYIGRVKGTRGAILEAMKTQSGCTEVWGPRRDSPSLDFKVSAPGRANLEHFLAHVQTKDPNARLTVVGDFAIEVRDQATGRAWSAASRSSSARKTAPRQAAVPQSPSSPASATQKAAAPKPTAPARPSSPRVFAAEGPTVEDATATALRQLGVRRDQATVEVLAQPVYTRIRGRLKSPARVRVTTLN